MPPTPNVQRKSSAPRVIITIAGVDVSVHCQYLEWTSFVNGGYQIRGEIKDANHTNLKDLTGGTEDSRTKYLEEGRKKPTVITCQFAYTDKEEDKTEERVAYLTALHGTGGLQDNDLMFVGIDPPSFLLNSGTADGRVYKGAVHEVISKVIKDYTGKKKDDSGKDIDHLEVSVSKTNDSNENLWYMMRMDPKTFIGSLLDWSSSTTDDKARWIVSCKDTKINIKKESELKGEDFGFYSVAPIQNKPTGRDVQWWELGMNNFVSAFQTRLITSGISAVSGEYLDPLTAEDGVVVNDENTSKKVNVDVNEDRAFSKPNRSDVWPQGLPATYIMAVPEHNNRDVGLPYKDYIDGRARQRFMNMLSTTMRIAVEVPGDPRLSNSELLGVSTCGLQWKDLTEEYNHYFLHGCWVIYGFKHTWGRGHEWHTTLFLYRLDHDAEVKVLDCETPE